MFKRFFIKFVTEFKEQTPTVKAFIVLMVILIIGIILRWDTIISEVERGFNYFSAK